MGSFWSRDKRAEWQAELDAIEGRWQAFREQWPTYDMDPDLGPRIALHASKIADYVDSLDREVLVHGDCKTANIFYREESEEVKWIDFQWAGFGSPLMDIAYLIASSAFEVQTLDEMSVLAVYYESLAQELRAKGFTDFPADRTLSKLLEVYHRDGDSAAAQTGGSSSIGYSYGISYSSSYSSSAYPTDFFSSAYSSDLKKKYVNFHEFLEQRLLEYKWVFLDYGRVVLSYMWDGKVGPAEVEKRKKRCKKTPENHKP